MARIINDVTNKKFIIEVNQDDNLSEFGTQIAIMAMGGSIDDINNTLGEFYNSQPEVGQEIIFHYMKQIEAFRNEIVDQFMDDGFDDMPKPAVPADKAFGV